MDENSQTFISISAAVCLVLSSFSTRTLSPKKLLSAAKRRVSNSSSSCFNSILNVFCCLVSSDCRYKQITINNNNQTSDLTKLVHTHLQMLEVWSLQVDHLCEQLVLKPVPCDSKVNESGLSLDLRFIMGVCQLSMQNQSEVWMEITFLIPHFNTSAEGRLHFYYTDFGNCLCGILWGMLCRCVLLLWCGGLPALLDGLSAQQWINNWFNCLFQILNQYRLSWDYGLFNHIHIPKAAMTQNKYCSNKLQH